jgi:hypothetical protein
VVSEDFEGKDWTLRTKQIYQSTKISTSTDGGLTSPTRLFKPFSTALSTTLMIWQKIRREDLPEPPARSYKEMLKHQHKEGFFAAMKLELENVTKKKTYEIHSRSPD